MSENFIYLIKEILGKKRFEIFKFICENCDESGFLFMKLDDIMKTLKLSKPTLIASFKFLEEKKLLKRLKNGLYKIKLGEKNEA
ncbi:MULTISPECIES: replication/maintenance protein RepL [unclassified Campylobacter]|uniref:replication/maintenance protein RepL n=1 Tax=unclassified Campylobacter TaxID=2593542 RepID=UPI001237AE36|nr:MULTISPECIES: replication/maintenance protein RepL [unclassified Campylobacter]KAA6226511.1 ArsR family transcriptional regulator [Campylobacter sp. LR196d]KAA6227002.1 ArsR family transcriptional regulator [Campylobacter sp. LR185c]KAA6228157.1 ArsR family transcriptional regulator [Campylobacter sp. LR286c]KAA6229979.1 ArsR family transcriptional regulator [Campylobacter sp. LR291e]KAA6229985.1 ArsR family transcriptional regulator [Campylobacter sp. LR264d]